jgi:hypothetical protein
LAQQLTSADLADGARGLADQRFGDPGLALLKVQVGGPPVAQTPPMQAGKAVQMGKGHGVRISNPFSIRKEMFALKKARRLLGFTSSTRQNKHYAACSKNNEASASFGFCRCTWERNEKRQFHPQPAGEAL